MVSREGTPETAATSAAAETIESSPGVGTGRREGVSASNSSAAREMMTPKLAVKLQSYSNTRYHEDRQAFFEAASRWSNFATIILGSGAAATALSTHAHIAVIAGILTAVVGAGQLVFDFAGKARTHLELRKSFARIMAEAVKPDCDPNLLQVRMVELYEGEPEIFHAVNALAYNAAQLAFDRGPETTLKVSAWQKAFRHFWHFDPSDFKDATPARPA